MTSSGWLSGRLRLSHTTGLASATALALASTLGVFSVLSWVLVGLVNMPMAGTLDLTAFVLFTLIWGVGMVAMMFPSILPMVYTIVMSARKSSQETQAKVDNKLHVSLSAALFVLGYVAVWTVVGCAFYLAIAGLVAVGVPVGLGSFGFWAGIILLATGLYQFTRFKQESLMKCRSPMSFILTNWKNGVRGAGAMGADYGFFCTKCCWVLMLGLLVVGAMSLPLMGVFALVIFAEKILPKGRLMSRMIGVAFLATGIYFLV